MSIIVITITWMLCMFRKDQGGIGDEQDVQRQDHHKANNADWFRFI